MKLAFSTASFLDRNLGSVVTVAREFGYVGVDVGAVMAGPVVAEPQVSKRVAGEAGMEICCLASPGGFVGVEQRDRQTAEQVKKYVDAAAVIGCPFVQVGANVAGIGRSSVTAMLGDWLGPIGDHGGKCGVTLLLGNGVGFGESRQIWAVLDRLRHPNVACCWDVFVAATMGERPAVSVPTLNSRIRLVRVSDAKISADAAVECKLGEGDVAVEQFVERLRGIGYDGFVTVNSGGSAQMLADGAEKLRKWWTRGR